MLSNATDSGWWSLLVIPNTLVAAASAAVVRAARRRPAGRDEHGLVLQFDAAGRRRVVWFAGACGLQAVGWAIAASAPGMPWPGTICLGAVALGFGVVAMRVLDSRRWVVRASEAGIAVTDGRGVVQTLPFAAIRSVRLSPLLPGCELRGDAGQRLRFPGHLPGMRDLLRWLREHVPASRWRRWGAAVQSFQAAGRRAEQHGGLG